MDNSLYSHIYRFTYCFFTSLSINSFFLSLLGIALWVSFQCYATFPVTTWRERFLFPCPSILLSSFPLHVLLNVPVDAAQQLETDKTLLGGVQFRTMWEGAVMLIKAVLSGYHDYPTSNIRSMIADSISRMGYTWDECQWGSTPLHEKNHLQQVQNAWWVSLFTFQTP